MITFTDIHKSYDEQHVLGGIDLTFKEGKLTMLLGPSGCGKSTMLRLINRLIEPDKGEILIHGQPINREKSELLRRRIGYAIQGVGLFPHMNVRENIAVVPKLLKWDKKRIQERVDELMNLIGIPESYGNKRTSMLSGGEAQRVGVARALGADPDILLMDEPFGALDPVTRFRLQQEFVQLQQKLHKTVVFVTHDVGEAVRMADQLVLLHEGVVLSSGAPEEVALHENSIVKAFFGDQLTFELLDKYAPCHYAHLFFKNTYSAKMDTTNKVYVNEDESFRTIVSHMLKNGTNQVFIQKEGKEYLISFDSIVHTFGGNMYERK